MNEAVGGARAEPPRRRATDRLGRGEDEGWRTTFDHLLADGRSGDAAELLEAHLLSLVGRGDHELLRDLVDRLPHEDRSVLLRAGMADGSTRAVAVDLAVLESLEREAGDDVDLRAFIVATRAQHLLWRGDPLCLDAAQSGLDLLPDAGLASPLALLARGRLRLTMGIGTLFASFALAEPAGRLVDEAVTDLTRAGAVDEAAAAQAYYHGLLAAVTWTDVRDAAETVAAAGERLLRRRSPYAPFALVAEALLRFVDGDLWHAWRVLDAADVWDGPTLAFVPDLAAYVKLMARLIGHGPDEALDLEASLIVDGLDRHAPELAGGVTLTIGNVMCDLGDLPRARRWAARARQAPMPLPGDARDSDALWGRLLIADGRIDEGLPRALDAVAAVRENGQGRAAEVMLARVARTLRSVGRDDLAAPLRAEAASGLPGERTIWELVLLGPEPAGGGVASTAPITLRVRALAPDLAVEVGDAVHSLGRLPARIVGLLISEGRPLSLDRVLDAIWPDVELDAAKHRLAMALHRLRSHLPTEASGLVVRDQHGLRLAGPAEGVTSDVAELMAVDVTDLQAARRAVLAYGADFGERQLAYEDWAMATREWCRARWAVLAAAVLDAALGPGGEVADSLGLVEHVRSRATTEGELARRVVAVLVAAGHVAEAAAFVADARRAGVLTSADLDDLVSAIPA